MTMIASPYDVCTCSHMRIDHIIVHDSKGSRFRCFGNASCKCNYVMDTEKYSVSCLIENSELSNVKQSTTK